MAASSYLPTPPLSSASFHREQYFSTSPKRVPFAPSIPASPQALAASARLLAATLDDAPSSDSSTEPSSPLKGASDFNKLLHGHFRSSIPVSENVHLRQSRLPPHHHRIIASSSSSSPTASKPIPGASLSIRDITPAPSSPTLHRPRRSVQFSSTTLESAQSSPRRAQQAWANVSVYSAKPSTLFPSPIAASTSPSASSSYKRVSPLFDEADDSTDDEAESDWIQSHLIASAVIDKALVPSTPWLPPIPPPRAADPPSRFHFTPLAPKRIFAARSILKRSVHPIVRANSLQEGSRQNSGRRKYVLGWSDADAAAGIVSVATAAAQDASKTSRGSKTSASVSGAAGKSRTNGASGRIGSASSRQGGAGPSRGGARREAIGNGDDDDSADGRNPRRPIRHDSSPCNSLPAPQAVGDEDPVLFLSPLLTLRASLYSCQKFDSRDDVEPDRIGFLPRPVPRSDEPGMSPDYVNLLAPPTLPQIERAYALLTRAMLRLPAALVSTKTTLAPLQEHSRDLLQCVERDVANIISFPAYVEALRTMEDEHDLAARVGMSPPKKQGLDQNMVCRQRDEVCTATIAIKCVTAMARDCRLAKIFDNAEWSTLLSKVLSIPAARGLTPSVQKDLLPFLPWFLHQQQLPTSVISNSLASILPALAVTIRTVDKYRSNLSESILAVMHLLKSHPEAVLESCQDVWLDSVLDAMFEAPKKSMAIRYRVADLLAALVTTFSTNWSGTDAPESEAAKGKREDLAAHFGEAFIELTSSAEKDPSPWVKGVLSQGQKATKLHAIMDQFQMCLSTDDAPWAIQMLALLPCLLGKKFKRIESRGIRPWLLVVTKAREIVSPELRGLNLMLWNHLTASFLQTRDADGHLWAFRANKESKKKPWYLLVQPLGGSKQPPVNTWQMEQSDVELAARTVVLTGLIFGLTVVNRGLSTTYDDPALFSDDTDIEARADRQLDHLDFVWDKLVWREILNAIQLEHEPTSDTAWRIFTALLADPEGERPTPTFMPLTNAVFLSQVRVKVKDGVSPQPVELFEQAMAGAIKPHLIPGWSAKWIASRAAKVVSLLESVLNLDTPKLESQPLPSKMAYLPVANSVWTNFLRAFEVEKDEETRLAGLTVVAEWLAVKREKLGELGDHFLLALFKVLVKLGPQIRHTTALSSALTPLLAEVVSLSKSSLPVVMEQSIASIALEVAANLPNGALVAAEATMVLYKVASNDSLAFSIVDLVKAWQRIATLSLELEDVTIGRVITCFYEIQSLSPSAPLAAGQDDIAQAMASTVLATDLNASRFSELLQNEGDAQQSAGTVLGLLRATLVADQKERLLSTVKKWFDSLQSRQPSAFVHVVSSLLTKVLTESFTPLYLHVLQALSDIEPTSAELERISPLLESLYPRILALLSPTPSSEEQSISPALTAFRDFWKATFAAVTDDLILPPGLVDLLSVFRAAVHDDDFARNLGETQHSLPAARYRRDTMPSPPAPAQIPPTAVRASPSTASTRDISGAGYEADISTSLAATASTLAPAVRQGSPSLVARSEHPTSSQDIPETHPEILRQRSSSSMRSMASMASTSPSAAKVDHSGSKKRKLERSGAVSEIDAEDRAHVASSSLLTSAVSLEHEPATKKRRRPASATNSVPPANSPTPVVLIIAPKKSQETRQRDASHSSASDIAVSAKARGKRPAVENEAVSAAAFKKARVATARSDTGDLASSVEDDTDSSLSSSLSSPIPVKDAEAIQHIFANMSVDAIIKATMKLPGNGKEGLQKLARVGQKAVKGLEKLVRGS